MNRKNIFYWTLYDFANSIVIIVFFLYFSQWLVVEKGVSDFAYNMIFTAGSVLLLLTAPILASLADRNGKQHYYLRSITLLSVALFILTSLVTLFWSREVMLAILFFLLANYIYQFSFVFYNALLHKIAPPHMWGRISGLGQAGNWLGQVTGLLVTLPLATGAVYLVGEAGRAQTFLPATILFLLLTLPMLFLFKLSKQQAEPAGEKVKLGSLYREQWGKFRELIRIPGVGLFLLAYFFFNDAILTAANNFPIYLQNVFAVSDTTKSLLLMGILATSAIGALLAGWMADKVGLKKTLMFVLGSWVVILPLLGSVSNFKLFVVYTVIMGLLYGSVWAVTRAAMTALVPPERMNFGFSFYGIAERVSTLVGPVTWGLISTLLVHLGPTRYRIAVSAMAIFVIIGLLIMRKVQIPKTNNTINNASV